MCQNFWKQNKILLDQSIFFPGFPGGTVVENLPAKAGDTVQPWSGKIPRAAEQLSPCSTTT